MHLQGEPLVSFSSSLSANVAVSATSFDTWLHGRGGSAQRLAIWCCYTAWCTPQPSPLQGVRCGYPAVGKVLAPSTLALTAVMQGTRRGVDVARSVSAGSGERL
jgi:hypothetical protein